MNIRIRTVIVVVIVLGFGLVSVVFYVAHRGFSAREKPSRFEEFLARHLRRMATPAEAGRLKNPESLTPEIFQDASSHWMEHCAVCHATDGSGNTVIGRNVYPPAPDMKSSVVQDLSDGELFYIISNGVRFAGMPSWGAEDSPQEIWQLVAFIRRLPKLEPAELKLMEKNSAKEHSHMSMP